MTIGEKIKFLRNQKGFTQETLAEKLNVSRSAIAKWESNSGTPEISNLKMLSQVFNISVDELLDNEKHSVLLISDEKKSYACLEYQGHCYDIELSGWNDGVSYVFIIREDEDFIFYRKCSKKRSVYGIIGKRYISSIMKSKKDNLLCNEYDRQRLFLWQTCIH